MTVSRPSDVSARPTESLDVESVIDVRDLRMSYDGFEAVRGIDLAVYRGEVFAFLGPNGAGKTTSVEILEGFRHRTGGDVTVLGADPQLAGVQWRSRIGVVLQESQTEAELTVRECLTLYAGYYPNPRPIDETLELVGLSDRPTVRTGRLSGGQRRRLDVALALIGDPELIFLDEPTTGFDPAARRATWEVIAGLQALGKTIFLTTHYMEEAEYLADRIVVIAAGQIVAEGTPATLGGRQAAAAVITFTLPSKLTGSDLPRLAGSVEEVTGGQVRLRSENALADAGTLAAWAAERQLELPDFQIRRPSLEDIYLELVADK
jgi:ABC-2 type transport system ATP-binding protein